MRPLDPSRFGPVLTSARVRVEPIDPGRARAFLDGQPEPGLPWEEGFPPDTLHEALRRIVAADAAGGTSLGPFFAYVVVRRSDGRAIGDAGFHGPPGPDGEVEIGYALVPAARGAGLAADAARLLIDWAEKQPGVRSVAARTDAGNEPSRRTLARLGFARDGVRGELERYVRRDPPAPPAR